MRTAERRDTPCRSSTRSPAISSRSRRASRDELRRCSSSGCSGRCAHAYDNVAALPARVRRARACIPDDLQSLADLARFPFTVKSDLRDNYPFGMFAVPREQVVAHPRVVGHDRQADGRRLHAQATSTPGPTVMARSIRAAGGRAGDIVHVAYGYGLFTGGLGAHYGAEKLGCTVIPMSGGQTEKQVQLIRDFKPDIIMVTPSYMLAIAEEMRAAGHRSARSRRSTIGIFGAEPWTAGDARGDRGERWTSTRSTSTACRR